MGCDCVGQFEGIDFGRENRLNRGSCSTNETLYSRCINVYSQSSVKLTFYHGVQFCFNNNYSNENTYHIILKILFLKIQNVKMDLNNVVF